MDGTVRPLMALYDALADLPLQIDAYTLEAFNAPETHRRADRRAAR